MLSGVYLVEGPLGIYVGESVNCDGRNGQATKLGWPWHVVHDLAGDTPKEERMKAERMVADALEEQGFVVVSRNTTQAQHNKRRGMKLSPEHRAAMAAGAKRSWQTPEGRARLATMKGRKHSAVTRAKMKGRKCSAETRAKMRRSSAIRWAQHRISKRS